MKNDVENASASNTDEDTESDRNASGIQELWQLLAVLKELPPHEDRADHECCIYRVPNSLRDSNPEAYTPQLISIGPFHIYSARLDAMETLKRTYQGEFLKRNKMDEKKIVDFITRIQKEEESARLCYAERIDDSKDNFVQMIVLDAVFIIEFLKESCAAGFPKNIDTRMRFCIGEDLMLLENQLPFSILDLIYSEFYEKGVLKIPILKVDDSLERVVRNVMIWEQCSTPGEAYISNYFKFMDHLIDRAEDVALLAEEGIIINWLGDDAAVSKLMNNLSQRSETASYYSDICRELNEYYENPWNRRKATLNPYFDTDYNFPEIGILGLNLA